MNFEIIVRCLVGLCLVHRKPSDFLMMLQHVNTHQRWHTRTQATPSGWKGRRLSGAGTSFEERGNDEACSGGKYFFSQRSWTQVTSGILGSVYEDIIEDTQMLHGAGG